MKNTLLLKVPWQTKINPALCDVVTRLDVLARAFGLTFRIHFGESISPICVFSDDLDADTADKLKKSALEIYRAREGEL